MASTRKETFLTTSDQEHATTMRVLRSFPKEQADTKLHPNVKTARELAWTFVLERYLGTRVWHDEIAKKGLTGAPPKPPESWDEIMTALEKAHAEYRKLIASASDEDLAGKVHFFTAPKTMGEITRMDWAWFLLHDEIHHRGQFSILLRMAGAKVPSIYGPTADEPWM
jgi:uncharacterized damage-inducible protein DinB